MRPLALLAPLLFLVPTGVAAQEHHHNYVMGVGQGCSGGGLLIRNCETYFPRVGETNVTATVADVSGETVRIRICHEWTYDDGSHRRLSCGEGCSPTYGSDLVFPPWPHNTTYRVIVDLRNGPGTCAVEATAGTMRVSFT